MDLLANRAVAVAVGATVIVTGANLTAYAAGGHGFFSGHHQAARTAQAKKSHGAHVYEYVIPKHTPAPFEFQAKDLPKGRYAVTLSIATATSVTGSTLASPFCSVAVAHHPYAVFSYGVFSNNVGSSGFDVAINTGSGVAKVAKDGGASVTCILADRTYTNHHSTNLVTFTPISKLTMGKVRALVVPAKVASGTHFGR
jgi:uncharacterized protein (DUF3084 family)